MQITAYGPNPVYSQFLQIKLNWKIGVSTYLCIIRGRFGPVLVELNSCDRVCTVQQAYNGYHLILYKERVPMSDLE